LSPTGRKPLALAQPLGLLAVVAELSEVAPADLVNGAERQPKPRGQDSPDRALAGTMRADEHDGIDHTASG
jgi:hypothetical protein